MWLVKQSTNRGKLNKPAMMLLVEEFLVNEVRSPRCDYYGAAVTMSIQGHTEDIIRPMNIYPANCSSAFYPLENIAMYFS